MHLSWIGYLFLRVREFFKNPQNCSSFQVANFIKNKREDIFPPKKGLEDYSPLLHARFCKDKDLTRFFSPTDWHDETLKNLLDSERGEIQKQIEQLNDLLKEKNPQDISLITNSYKSLLSHFKKLMMTCPHFSNSPSNPQEVSNLILYSKDVDSSGIGLYVNMKELRKLDSQVQKIICKKSQDQDIQAIDRVGPIQNQGNTCFLASALHILASIDAKSPLFTDMEAVNEEAVVVIDAKSPSFTDMEEVNEETIIIKAEKRERIISERRALKNRLKEIIEDLRKGKSPKNLIELEKLINRADGDESGQLPLSPGRQNCTAEAVRVILDAILPKNEQILSPKRTIYEYKSVPSNLELERNLPSGHPAYTNRENIHLTIRAEPPEPTHVCTLDSVQNESTTVDQLIKESIDLEELPPDTLGEKTAKGCFFASPPDVFPIHLNRYRGQRSKSKVQLDFSETFVMEPPYSNEKATYRLKSFSVHHGSVGGGHYTAYVRNSEDQWFHANDSHVHLADPQRLIKDFASNSCFFIYEKI